MTIPWQDHLIRDDLIRLPDDYVENPDYVKAATSFMEPLGPSIWLVRASTIRKASNAIALATPDGNAQSETCDDGHKESDAENDYYDDDDDNDQEEVPSSARTNASTTANTICAMTTSPSLLLSKLASLSTKSNGDAARASSHNDTDESTAINADDEDPVTVVVALQSAGGAWVWNPNAVPCLPELRTEITARCGDARHLVFPTAASSADTTRLREWIRAFPSAKLYVTPDRELEPDVEDDDDNDDSGDDRRKSGLPPPPPPITFDFLLTEDPKRDYVLDIDQVIFRGGKGDGSGGGGKRAGDEVVFFHKPSKTVLLADLVHHFDHGSASKQTAPPRILVKALETIVAPIGMPLPTTTMVSRTMLSASSGDDDQRHAQAEAEAASATEAVEVGRGVDTTEVTTVDNAASLTAHAPPRSSYYTPYARRWSSWWHGHDRARPYRTALNKMVDVWQPTSMVLAHGHVVAIDVCDVLSQTLSWIDRQEDPDFEHDPDHVPVERFGRLQRETWSTGASTMIGGPVNGPVDDDGDGANDGAVSAEATTEVGIGTRSIE